MQTIHFRFNTWRSRILRDQGGFLTDHDVEVLAGGQDTRLTQVLVRAGSCRLVCSAQDVAHIEACLVAGGDYIRDVSMSAGEGV